MPRSLLSKRATPTKLVRLPSSDGTVPLSWFSEEVKQFQADEVAHLGRNLSSQLIRREIQQLQVGEAAQFWRNRSSQLVLREVQFNNATVCGLQ